MPEVLIAPMTLANFDGEYRRILRDAGFDLVFPERAAQLNEDELIKELVDKQAVLAGSEPYTKRVIEACPRLRIIARQGVGHDAVDLEAATAAGVVVTTTPGSNHEAVAEHTFALMLALAKNVVPHDRLTRAGDWPRRPGLPLRDENLAIVGLGRIGKAVAIRAAAFGMNLLASEIQPDADFMDALGIRLMPFGELIREADYLTFHVPLTAQTRHMLDRFGLETMKPSAFVINTSRGGVIAEADLAQALERGQIAGAALDVYENEPAVKHALFSMENVVVSAHSAGIDRRSRADMALFAAQAIVSVARGEWPDEKVVNPQVRRRFRWA